MGSYQGAGNTPINMTVLTLKNAGVAKTKDGKTTWTPLE